MKSTKSAPATKSAARKPAASSLDRKDAARRQVITAEMQSAINAPDVLAAVGGVAPKGNKKDLRSLYLQHLAAGSKVHSAAYVNSLRRPVGEFIDWCAQNGIENLSDVTTKVLTTYRGVACYTDTGELRARSTARMTLARVSTFLRSLHVNADYTVLRIKLTEEESRKRARRPLSCGTRSDAHG